MEQELEQPKMYTPKNDLVFRMLFGEQKNEKITKGLIEDILGEQVDEIDLSGNPELYGKTIDDKLGIVDVKAVINKEVTIDLEMQVSKYENLEERILFYWARMYEKQVERGELYNKLHRCISIIFVEEPTETVKDMPIQTKWQIREEKNRDKILTNRLEIYIIKISEKEKGYCKEELRKWLVFLRDPYGKEIEKVVEEKEEIKEAREELDKINSDYEKRYWAELREKYVLDRNSQLNTAKKEGMAEGKKEIAKKLKQKNMSLNEISEITGLTEEEINGL